MSWSPDVFIGELRPWPDTVHVVRGKTDETRRYVPESESDQLQAENAKLRELVSELWVSCPVHESDCGECQHKGGRRGCELYDRILELGVDA